MPQQYNRIIDDAVKEVSIEKPHSNNKSRFFDGINAYRGLS